MFLLGWGLCRNEESCLGEFHSIYEVKQMSPFPNKNVTLLQPPCAPLPPMIWRAGSMLWVGSSFLQRVYTRVLIHTFCVILMCDIIQYVLPLTFMNVCMALFLLLGSKHHWSRVKLPFLKIAGIIILLFTNEKHWGRKNAPKISNKKALLNQENLWLVSIDQLNH